MDFKVAVVMSCWFAVALISSVYMIVFGPNVDIMFGVFMPIGFLLLVAIIVTFAVIDYSKSEKK